MTSTIPTRSDKRKKVVQTPAQITAKHVIKLKEAGRTRTTIEISDATKTKLQEIGYARGISMGAVVDELVASLVVQAAAG